MSSEEERNPCSFKSVCKNCTMTEIDDRPEMCVSLDCTYLSICKGCGNNKTLNENELCKPCATAEGKQFEKDKVRQAKEAIRAHQNNKAPKGLESTSVLEQPDPGDAEPPAREYTLTRPGTPPGELTQDEVGYYNHRWSEYKGYYRNPSAYFVCHLMILEEINLAYINAKVLSTRGEAQSIFVSAKSASIKTLESLQKQLPEKESEQLSEDEKSLSWIYESYVQERKKRYAGGMARLLSREAIALAPLLYHPIDPRELLIGLGYSVGDVDSAIAKLNQNAELVVRERTPEDILIFFGFTIDEEYAQPFDVQEEDREEEEEEAVI